MGSAGGLPRPWGEEAREFAVEPADEVAHRGVDTNQRGLGEALPPEVLQKRLRDQYEPLVRPVVAVEVVIEGQEAV